MKASRGARWRGKRLAKLAVDFHRCMSSGSLYSCIIYTSRRRGWKTWDAGSPILLPWCVYYFSPYSGRKYHIRVLAPGTKVALSARVWWNEPRLRLGRKLHVIWDISYFTGLVSKSTIFFNTCMKSEWKNRAFRASSLGLPLWREENNTLWRLDIPDLPPTFHAKKILFLHFIYLFFSLPPQPIWPSWRGPSTTLVWK